MASQRSLHPICFLILRIFEASYKVNNNVKPADNLEGHIICYRKGNSQVATPARFSKTSILKDSYFCLAVKGSCCSIFNFPE